MVCWWAVTQFVARTISWPDRRYRAQHLNWFIVEQLPVIAPGDYNRRFGDTTARDLVRDHVLRLTYTAHDMTPFARDLGYDGPPFTWDEEERRHLRARLDALYFHLYGLARDDADYVLEHLPHRPPGGRGRVRLLSHTGPRAGVHERARRRETRRRWCRCRGDGGIPVERKLTLGVIGLGGRAASLLGVFRRVHSGLRVAAVADPDRDGAEAATSRRTWSRPGPTENAVPARRPAFAELNLSIRTGRGTNPRSASSIE